MIVLRRLLEGIRAAHLEEFFGSLKTFSVKLIEGANWFCWFGHDTEIDWMCSVAGIFWYPDTWAPTVNSC